MMRSQCSVIVILWLVALFCDISGFTIKRQHEQPHTDLSQAFRALQRQRRRINELDYLTASRLPDIRDQLMPSDLAGWAQEGPSREEEEWLDNPYSIEQFGDDSYSPEDLSDESAAYPERPPVAVEKEEPSKEELESIFDESDSENDSQPQTDSSDEANSEHDDDSSASEQIVPEKRDELDDLTEDEYKALMSAVEKLQKKALAKKDTSTVGDISVRPKTEDVSTEELKEVFGDKGDEDSNKLNNDATENVSVVETESSEPSGEGVQITEETFNKESGDDALSDTDKETISSIGKYWMLGNILNNGDKRRKRFTKRAPIEKPPNSVPLEETYRQEIGQLREEIQQLKLMTQIEDMENDALTQTLNEATLSQMEGSVSQKEFQSLENAINLEEALQDLRKGHVNPLIVELLAADAVGDLDKRGEPLWKKEKRMDDADLEQSYPMFPDDKRAVKREKEYPPWAMKSAKRAELKRGYDAPLTQERKEERDNYLDAQEAIESLVSQLAASEMPEDDGEDAGEEDNVEDDIDEAMLPQMMPAAYSQDDDTAVIPYNTRSQTGECPSMALLTDCKFADLQGLPIDDEARELCNRHEMCYECGATTRVKQGECDSLYRAQASALCNEDAECVIEAELFLRELKLKHRYSTFYEPTCDNSCTEDYIGL